MGFFFFGVKLWGFGQKGWGGAELWGFRGGFGVIMGENGHLECQSWVGCDGKEVWGLWGEIMGFLG